MRTEKEIYELILSIARNDARIRAVYMNGSRANPNAPKDAYQDYDIVYVVSNFESFIANHKWIDIFGERFMLQMPEVMRDPSGAGHFNWMMLFTDGSRLDLTLIPIEKPELISKDSQTITLLDKDGILPTFPAASDKDYHITPPTDLDYQSCCNNFWWCLQNVAKGIARDELPYAMLMYHEVVRADLHDMLTWYIGTTAGYAISAGKMGKYFKTYLPPKLYKQYQQTYSDSNTTNMWKSITHACDLFSHTAIQVANATRFNYNNHDDKNMRTYLNNVKNNIYKL